MNIKQALEYIKGYCEKHTFCADCPLFQDEDNCCFADLIIPCDWNVDEIINNNKTGG